MAQTVQQSEAIVLGLRIGGRIVAGLWALFLTAIGVAVGGSIYLTKLDVQLSGAVSDVKEIKLDIREVKGMVVPQIVIDDLKSRTGTLEDDVREHTH